METDINTPYRSYPEKNSQVSVNRNDYSADPHSALEISGQGSLNGVLRLDGVVIDN